MTEQTSPMHEPAAGPLAAPRRVGVSLRDIESAITGDWARALTVAALALILLVGGYLRLSHNNWDAKTGPWDTSGQEAQSGQLHPDERFLTSITNDTHAPDGIFDYFNTDKSRLNPYNISHQDGSKQPTFVYGTLPLFLNKFLASHLRLLSLGMADNYDDYDHYNLSGRMLAALFDLATVLLIFFLGRELANRQVGLLAAFLYAFSAFAIQNAHFFVVDPFVTTFATLAVLFAVRSAKHGRYRDFAVAGAAVGLAAACKITAISLLPVVLLAIGVYAWPGIKPYVAPWWDGDRRAYAGQRDGVALDRSLGLLIVGSAVALIAAFIAFRIAMPYAFKSPDLVDLFSWRIGHFGAEPAGSKGRPFWDLGFPYPDIMNQHWLKDQIDQRQLLSGDAAFPPNVQWIGRSKWLWPAQQVVSWGMGPALGITAWLGVIFAAAHALRKREGVWLVPLAWVLGYFGFMGAQFSLYMRYFLPLYPTLTVLAAFLLYRAWHWAEAADLPAGLRRFEDRLPQLRPALAHAAKSGVAVVVVFTALMGLAFYNIYRSPVTRVEASKWVYENVPQGTVIGHEHWDDEVPYAIAGVTQRSYGSETFNNFDPDSPERVSKLLATLDKVDYIALSSRRLSGTIPRVPALWPVTSRYYAALDDGSLGFEKAAEFTSYPRLFGVELDDTGAEESYSVYDHPRVTIYRKTDAYSHDRAVQVLHADAYPVPLSVLPGDAGQNLLQFKPDVLATQQAGGTWSDIFSPGNFVNRHPLIFWLLAIEIAAFALVPLAVVGFRGLPDRGFLLTKPLGVLGLSYLVYAPASRGWVHFTRGEIAAALTLMAIVGIATGWLWRDEIVAWVRERWRFLLIAEAIFLFAFLFSYWLRMQNPDLFHPSNGGEKPMDFAYLNGVIRTTDLSQGPIDPWNAGGYINYYWYGQFIGATITKLTGIVPEVAYNLIVPMFFALTAAATFSVAYNLSEGTRRLMRRRPDGLPIGTRGPIIAGVVAIFLVLIAGNIEAVNVLVHNVMRQPDCYNHTPRCSGAGAFFGGLKALAFGDGSFRKLVYTYDWWAPSRALGIIPTPKNSVGPITEFPFWTFLFADLHAHLMAIPFAMTATGVALGAVMNFTRLNPIGAAQEHLRARTISSWAMVVVLGLIVGALRWINSWDYPPFLLLGAAALIIAERARAKRLTLRVLATGSGKAVVMGVLSYAFFAPFAKNYSQSYNGFHQADQTTAVTDYFGHFGILLFLVSGLLVFLLYRSLTRSAPVRLALFGRRPRGTAIELAPAVIGALTLAAIVIVFAMTRERWGVIGLAFVGLAAVVLCTVREARSASPASAIMLFVLAMIGLGFGLSGGVEMLTLDGDIGRMNTVFKFYLHVWMMWGVVGAFSLWYLFAVMRPQQAVMRRAAALPEQVTRIPRYAFAAVALLLLALALVYPYFGTRARIHDRFNPAQGASNDGLAYLNSGFAYNTKDPQSGKGGIHDMANTRDGINWIREYVQGSPTTLEAIGPSYRSLGSRVAIDTGLPTVSGWGFHQSQQRNKFAPMVDQRQKDVNEFYTTADVSRARQIIRKYDVEYVIVGDEEQFNYPASGLVKFQDGLGGALELAYQNPSMQIWHVIPQAELAVAP